MIALLYDIHGNLPALEAVLADAERAGAERYVLGGDYALFGGWPAECVERLRELPADWLRGNCDRWLGESSDAPPSVASAIEACRELLPEGVDAELAALPAQLERGGALLCHASPLSDVRSFLPEPDEADDELLAGASPARLVIGHTHLQFARTGPRGVELVNPGSVGMPMDGDHRAAYALLHDDGRIEQRRAAYDHASAARRVREVLGEAGEGPARRIERAVVDL